MVGTRKPVNDCAAHLLNRQNTDQISSLNFSRLLFLAITPVTSANASPVTGRSSVSQSENHESIPAVDPTALVASAKLESPSHQSTISNVLKSDHGSLSTNSSTEIPNAEQLKYENDRLKLALAQR